MGAISKMQRRRDGDPRVRRTRTAVVAAARTLFLEKGYTGTTMADIAAAAGITKRTLYNNYADKEQLFRHIAEETIAHAEAFARGIRGQFRADMTRAEAHASLHELGQRLAFGVVRPEVIALRRLLIREARAFPELARGYYERAPGAVLRAIAAGMRVWMRAGLMRKVDSARAAEHFAYSVIGGILDRAILLNATPPPAKLRASAEHGVEMFLAGM